MLKLLELYPKTRPTNYELSVVVFINPEAIEPGGTLTEEAWAKAIRQEDPNYDWYGYTQSVNKALFDHPAFSNRESDQAMAMQWNDLLKDLEPFNKRAI